VKYPRWKPRPFTPLRRCLSTQWGADVSVSHEDELVLLDVVRGLGRAHLTPAQARELAWALTEAATLMDLRARARDRQVSRNWNGPALARTVAPTVPPTESRGGGIHRPRK
jgi:hypothetical protein